MPPEFKAKGMYLLNQISEAELLQAGSLKFTDEQLIALIATEMGTARHMSPTTATG